MGDVEELKTELASLKAALKDVLKKEEGPSQRVVFTPKQRKLEKYSGRTDCVYSSVYEFVEEFQRILKSRPTNTEEQVDFLISHLEGPAKEEIRYRQSPEKNTPEKILSILKETFGERATTSELMAEFYQTKQGPQETLRDFSHTLMKRLERVLRLDVAYVSDKDKLLRNQFSENVSDTWLKRELKKIIRARPAVTFTDIREEAVILARDQDETPDCRPRHTKERQFTTVYSESVAEKDLTQFMSEMRQEMASLRLEVQELKQKKKEKTCYLCHQKGHFKKNCPTLTENLNGKNLSSRAGR
jgi:hypothetical protein